MVKSHLINLGGLKKNNAWSIGTINKQFVSISKKTYPYPGKSTMYQLLLIKKWFISWVFPAVRQHKGTSSTADKCIKELEKYNWDSYLKTERITGERWPGFLEVRAISFWRTRALMREDFPTLDLPMIANSGRSSLGQSLARELLFTNTACLIRASPA